MARVCPSCGALNADSEPRCHRCQKRFPGPWSVNLSALTGDLIVTRGVLFVCLLVFGLAVVVDGNLPIAGALGIGRSFRGSTLLRFGILYYPMPVPEWWRLVSANFLHFDALHIAMNMSALVSFGAQVERRFGWARALIVFVLSGVAGFGLSIWWYFESGVVTCGASAALFGQLGAIIGFLVAKRSSDWKALAINNLVMALIIALLGPVNTAAHIGGFVAGFVLGYAFERERVRPFATALFSVVAVVCALASVGSLLASALSPEWRKEREGELLREL